MPPQIAPFVKILASCLSVILFVLAALHVHWAVRGASSGAAVPTRLDGRPLFRPGRITTVGVAIALSLAGIIVLGSAHLLGVHLPVVVQRTGIWGVALAFGARTIGEFRYVGLFKRVHGTPFATWDTRVFTPLCAIMSLSAAVLAVSNT